MNTDIVILSDVEVDRLRELEEVVDRHRQGFLAVLAALEEIKSSRLYRATHSSFKDYLKERFGFSPSYASRLRSAAVVVEEARRLSGDVDHGQPPAERAVRELTDLPVEEAARILVVAAEKARVEGRDVPTVTDVREARNAVLPEQNPDEYFECHAAGYTWPRVAETIESLVAGAVEPADRQGVLAGLADLRWNLELGWGLEDGPLAQAIRNLEHVAARSDEEFRQHHHARADLVRTLAKRLLEYDQRTRLIAENDRKVAALVPGSLWEILSPRLRRFRYVDRVDASGVVWYRKYEDPSVVVRQKTTAFLETVRIPFFSDSGPDRRLREKVRSTFAKALDSGCVNDSAEVRP